MSQPTLKRAITLPMLTLYGLGTIIGAGIFVLLGEVATTAGIYTPFSFLLAAVIAGFTALSYAELASRFPMSAGEAFYLEQTFHQRYLSTLMGAAITLIGVVSAATITNGSIGYIQVFVPWPDWLITLLLVLLLSLLAAWGISESVKVAVITTSITILALLLIIFSHSDTLLTLPERLPKLLPPADFETLGLITMGAFIAFYAFIGFEDMINIAEEVKEPEANMPKSIILALIITALLYTLIALIAVLALPVQTLADSKAPLMELIHPEQPLMITVIGIISVFAVTDGILIQIIKTSRILFGLGKQKLIPERFSSVHEKTRTPLFATAVVAAMILFLSLTFPLVTLAKFTSFLTLIVFAAINFSLWRYKLKNKTATAYMELPLWCPITGFVISILFILLQLYHLL